MIYYWIVGISIVLFVIGMLLHDPDKWWTDENGMKRD